MTERVMADANGRKYITTEPRLDQSPDYERGFVDGMLHQTQSSVDKAVNRMAQPAQEPEVWGMRSKDGQIYDVIRPKEHAALEGSYKVPLYTTPPKRPWVGLTDEEIKAIVGPYGDTPIKGYTRKLFDQIEAALKEKNYG